MATTYLSRTFGTNNSGVYKWTYSFWIKRGNLGTSQVITTPYVDSNTLGIIRFNATDVLEVYDYQSSFKLRKITNRVFRDTSAWYNIVISSDNSVSSPVFKLFINGVQETSFSTDTNYSQNQATMFNKNILNVIGRIPSQEYFDGSISHMHFIDGTAYDASTFGETDATSGEWKIKTSPSVTYGTNGFFILKDGNGITDQSGEGNNFTVGGGTLTDLQDCPDDVFATLNPLNTNSGSNTFSDVNTKHTVSGNWLGISATIAVNKGKFYWELKNSGGGNMGAGVGKEAVNGTSITYFSTANNWLYDQSYNYGYYRNGSGTQKGNNNTTSTYGVAVGSGDILMVALDADNGKLFTGRNGTWFDSSDPANGTSPMYTITIGSDWWYPIFVGENNNTEINFGNGYFGTTAISSEGTNASGIGKFEYDVPTGYTALSTKGLQE